MAAGLLLIGGPVPSAVAAPSCTTLEIDSGLQEFRGIHGSSDTNVFAVGKRGTIYRYDGTGWTDQTGNNQQDPKEDLRDVHVVDTTTAFAVGKRGTILEYDGTDWNVATLVPGTDEEFKGVWAASATEAYAVGKKGTVYVYDGTDWTDQSAAAGAGAGGRGSDFEDAWGDGSAFYGLTKAGTLFRFDRTLPGWDTNPITACEISPDHDFKDLWGDTSGNIFLSGKDKRGAGGADDAGVVYKYDISAGTCTEVVSTTTTKDLEGIYGSIGTSAGGNDEIYAVGKKGNYLYSDDGGVTWTELVAPVLNAPEDIKDVWVSPTGKTFMAGKKGQWTYCALATEAEIGEVTAYRSAVVGSVVQWETLTERGTLGFHLLRLDPESGKYRQLNKRLLPGLLYSRLGGKYRFLDPTAEPGQVYSYKLVEVETAGTKRTYGPYQVRVHGTPPPVSGGSFIPIIESDPSAVSADIVGSAPVVVFEQSANQLSAPAQTRIAAKREARKKAKKSESVRTGPALKIAVREPGIYYLHASSLARGLGEPESSISQRIGKNELRLTNRGARIATLAAAGNTGIYFYGEGIESQYTEDNVYWLRAGRGLEMTSLDGGSPPPAGRLGFTDTSHAEGNRFHLTTLFDDPDGDYWMWDFIFPSEPGGPVMFDSREVAIASPGVASDVDAKATLTVRLHGSSESALEIDHRAAISINDEQICTTGWAGIAPHEAVCEVDLSVLNDGANTVKITGFPTGLPMEPSLFFINDLDLSYLRKYTSLNDTLAGDSGGYGTISVDGFSSTDVLVFDLRDQKRPRLVTNTTVDGPNGNYRVSFDAPKNGMPFIALTPEAVTAPFSVVADVPSNLRDQSQRVDWLLITASDLVDAAAGLADYRRRSQGLRTLIVDIEDIYDEFNDGIRSVDAIWTFLRYAYTRWQIGPRYVVLAGEGSFDYKNYLGFGDSIIPTLLTPTPNGLFPSDNLLADVLDNDWVPEMAVGRLPVIDAAELQAVTRKLIAYERSGGDWEKQSILSADAQDDAGNFGGDSERLLSLFPPELMTVETIHVDADTLPPDVARVQMLDGLNTGKAFVNFYGHAGRLGLGNADLINSRDVPGLGNGQRLPVITAFTCLVGQFGFPGQESLGEVLMVEKDAGAVAVWAPSGLSLHDFARNLGEGFYSATFGDGELIIGEAVLKAQAAYATSGADRYLLDIYNLIGDPATVMK